MREHIKADEPFERVDVSVGDALERFVARGSGLQGRADRGPRQERGRRRPSRSTPTARSPTSAAARTPRPRSASRRSSSSPSPAPTGAATPTGRCSPASTARRSSARTTSPRTASASSRPARATTASSASELGAVHVLRAVARLTVLAAERDGRLELADRSCGASRTSAAATARSRRRSSTTSSCGRSSGHWDNYRDNMYFTDVEDRPMGLKPMNCPAHVQLYKNERRSYRDLPIRFAEQGLVHRHEPAGTLHGLLRVRHITQDDAHIFCTEEQIQDEVIALPRLRLLHLRPVRLRAAARALDAPGQAHRHRRDVGRRRGGARGRAEAARASTTSSTRATARSTARRSTCT